MTAQQTILVFLSVLLPVVGVILPGIFKQDKLSQQLNGVIATVIIVIVAALQAWSEGQLNLVNPWLDFWIVLAGTSALLAGPFKNVDLYIQGKWGMGTATTGTTPAEQPPFTFSDLLAVLVPLVTALQQHTQAITTLQVTQPTSLALATGDAPVHGPGDVSLSDVPTVQTAHNGTQTSIPAFTNTAEIAAVTVTDQSDPQKFAVPA